MIRLHEICAFTILGTLLFTSYMHVTDVMGVTKGPFLWNCPVGHEKVFFLAKHPFSNKVFLVEVFDWPKSNTVATFAISQITK